MRPAVRLAAMSRAHVIYSWTHDSIGLGEDGPTHEPIEHLASLRAMPGLLVVRPADANETAQAWRCAVDADQPVALVLSRQAIPVLAETADGAAEGLARGRLRAATGGRASRPRARRHRQRGAPVPRGGRPAGRAGQRGARRVAPVLGVVRGPGRRLPRLGPARPACPRSRSRRPRPSAGTATRTRAWPSTPSARRRPSQAVLDHFGFTVDHVFERALELLGS